MLGVTAKVCGGGGGGGGGLVCWSQFVVDGADARRTLVWCQHHHHYFAAFQSQLTPFSYSSPLVVKLRCCWSHIAPCRVRSVPCRCSMAAPLAAVGLLLRSRYTVAL